MARLMSHARRKAVSPHGKRRRGNLNGPIRCNHAQWLTAHVGTASDEERPKEKEHDSMLVAVTSSVARKVVKPAAGAPTGGMMRSGTSSLLSTNFWTTVANMMNCTRAVSPRATAYVRRVGAR